MNILHLGKYYPPFVGGIEHVMRDIMSEQHAAGHKVSAVVHHHTKKNSSDSLEDRGISIKRMSIQMIILYVPIALLAIFHIRTAIKNNTPDILHLHMPNLACLWLLFLPAARKIPWIVHWHSDVIGESPAPRIKLLYPYYRFCEQWLLARAHRIIVTSPNYLFTSAPLKKWHDKASVIPLALEPTTNSTQSINRDSERDVLHVICIGRLAYYKGHRFLIDAIRAVNHKGVKVSLHIAGRGELAQTLRRQASDARLDNVITFHEDLSNDDLSALLNQADVLCLPSIERTEAFGLVLLEAMRAKKACVVTDVKGSGMSYVVEHLKTGLVVEHSSAEALAHALMHCADHPQHLIDWGNAGYERLQYMFSLPTIAAKVEDIYHQVLAPHEQSNGNL